MTAQRKMLAALVLAATLASACASAPTTYAPAPAAGDIGYRDTRIEADRWRVTFQAGPDVKGDRAFDLALRRAAEIGAQNGFDWFRIVSRATDASGSQGGGTRVGIGGSTGSYGSGVGVGIGIDLSPDRRKFAVTLEALYGRGEKPAEVDAYSVRSVLDNAQGQSPAS